MNKLLLFLLVLSVFIACKKSEPTPAGSSVNGVLHYDYLVGKLGVYYETDSNKIMLLENKYANDSLLYDQYKLYVNINTTMYYNDHGDTACYAGNTTICGLPVVEVLQFVIR